LRNERIAQILFDAFLMVHPFERRDIHFAADRYRMERGPIAEGAKFVAIYDQTYGSLHLSSRIMDDQTSREIKEKLNVVMQIQIDEGRLERDSETAAALGEILAYLGEMPGSLSVGRENTPADMYSDAVRVVLPGSKGLNLRDNNEEFFVEDVFYSPHYKGLAYRGSNGYMGKETNRDVKTIVALESMIEIPGESKMGLYNTESGEIVAI